MGGLALTALLALPILTACAAGCSTSNNRVPSQAEVKKADQKRQAYVDSLKLPDNVKAAMKSHMGGPPVQGQSHPAAPGNSSAQAGAPQNGRK